MRESKILMEEGVYTGRQSRKKKIVGAWRVRGLENPVVVRAFDVKKI
jgi:hypothetical protein